MVRAGAGRWTRTIGLACLAALFLGGTAIAKDKDLAKFLLEGGKKAVGKRDYDEGVKRLKKALAEDEALIEAHYWIGFARDKQKDMASAVAGYRAFRDACAKRSNLPKSLASLLRKAKSRLKVLAAGETELEKLNQRFAKEASALAEKSFLRDPELARRAAQAAIALAPGHKGALKILTKMGVGVSNEPSGEGPTKDVLKWKDFLGDSMFGTNPGWSYSNHMLKIDKRQGQFITPSRAFESPEAYVYEIEAKFLEFRDDPGVGICFGVVGPTWVTCHMNPGEVVLWKTNAETRSQENLVRHPHDPLKLDTWYRLAVAVKGPMVEVFWNGKKIFERKVSNKKHLAGDVGTFCQHCVCQIRVLRFGERK